MGSNFRAYTHREVDENVLDLARQRIADAFDRFDTIAVSFSGGKDSTVILNLAAEEAVLRRRDLHVHFNDEEVIPLQTIEYVERAITQLRSQLGDRLHFNWWCLPFRYHNVCSRRSPWWFTWDPACPEKWIRPIPENPYVRTDDPAFDHADLDHSWADFNALSYDTAKLGTVGVLLGIRADESLTRNHAVTLRQVDNYIIGSRLLAGRGKGRKVPGVMKVYPIYDWRTPDVWLAPRRLGWDYNHAYDLLDKVGITPDLQRLAPPFHAEGIIGLQIFAECFPEIWERVCNRVPGVKTAWRYGNTELYSYRATAAPGPGETWQDQLADALSKWEPDVRETVKQKVSFYVKFHYTRTTDPIIDYPHPVTGISWPFLIKVAIRGDLKERMRPEKFLLKNRAKKHPEVWRQHMDDWIKEGKR